MAYLTKYNSLKILVKINPNQSGSFEGTVYKKPIYFFSDYEKNKLLGLQALLKDPERFITEYYVPIEMKDTLRYVFEGGRPAYHASPNCQALNSNYKNFKIPSAITEKGEEEVLKFRKWFKANQYLLDQPDLFAARIQAAFSISINLETINHENSGIEIKENINLNALEHRIDTIISEAGKYYTNASPEKKYIIKKFQKHTFLAYSKNEIINNNTRFKDEVLKGFLLQYDIHFKRPIKELLSEYYRVKYNPDLKFEGQLLELLGFRPCAACYKHLTSIETVETN